MRPSKLTLASLAALSALATLSLTSTSRAQCFSGTQGLEIKGYAIGAGGWSVSRHPRLVGDVDGDGRADMVGFGEATVSAALSTGDGFRAATTWFDGGYTITKGGWRVDRHPRLLGDVDGDGRDDIVGFSEVPVSVALSTGEGFGTPSVWLDGSYTAGRGGWSVARHPRLLGDVNGDGMSDIIGFSGGPVTVALSTGESFAAPAVWLDGAFTEGRGGWRVDSHPRLVGDVNGDGLADIVGFSANPVAVSLSNGEGFDAPTLWLTGAFTIGKGGWRVDRHPRILDDVNGDGLADIVGFAETGVNVSLSAGDRFLPARRVLNSFANGAGGWRVDRHPRFLGDVNADGRADIVGCSEAGVVVARTISCFELDFTGPESVVVFPDAVETLSYTARMGQRVNGPGAEAWSYGMACENGEIRSVRFEESDAAALVAGGFHRHELVENGAVGSVVLSFGEGVALPAIASIAFVDVEVDFGQVDAGENLTLSYADLANTSGRVTLLEVVAGGAAERPDVRSFSTFLEPTPEFVRGDVSGDGELGIVDTVSLFNHLFQGDPATLRCEDAGDVDDSGALELTDGIVTLNFLFAGGTEPASPFPNCGIDSTRDDLTCESYFSCDD